VRVLVVSNMYPGPENPDYGAFVHEMRLALERRGVETDLAAIDTRASGPLATPAKYVRLLAATARRARRCDVIYAHYLIPTGAIAAACGRVARRPWVLTAHGRDVRNLSSAAIRAATGRALHGASALIAVSEYLADELRKSGLRLPPVEVANMGVDLNRFTIADSVQARRRLGLDSGEPLVLAVGGLSARKNPLGLLQAFVRVRQEFPGARLAFVGDGPQAGAVRAGVRRLNLNDAVLLAGVVEHAEVATWMAACNVLALPSLVEPLGVVALEALASGRGVIATRVGGAAEVVPASGPGRHVDPSSPIEIAAAIVDLLRNPPTPNACREVAAANSVDLQADVVLGVLRRAISGSG
jgi:glycosyltransferase involved in cell wall biosynthesis